MCGIFPSNIYQCKYTTARNRTTCKVASLFHLEQISPNRRQKATPVLCKIYYLHRLDIQRLYARVLHSEYIDRVFSLFSVFPPIDNEIIYRTMLQTLCHWILMNWYWTARFHTRSKPRPLADARVNFDRPARVKKDPHFSGDILKYRFFHENCWFSNRIWLRHAIWGLICN